MSREVPEGWRSVRLGEVAREDRGRNADGKIPSERLVGVFKKDGMIPMRERVKGVSVDRCKIVQPGSFAYNPMRINIGSIARSSHADAVMVSPDYVVFSANERMLDGSYLEHLRRSAEWEAYVGNAGDGGVRIRIYFDHLAEFRFALPPLHEQRRIAEILSSVDEAIAATRAVIEQTRKVKQGVLDRLLTKGIGHTRFKQTEIGEIPEGWTVATLAEAGVAILDGDRGKEYPKAEDYQEEGYCLFLSAKNVTRSGFVFDECQFLSEEKHLKLRNGLLQRSDIVVTTRGTIGNFAFYGPDIEFDCLRINSGMALMRSIRSQIHPHFLFALTASELIDDQLKRRVFGSAQPQLTLDILRKLVVPVPPEAEQVSIAAQANDLLEIERHQRVQLTAIERFKSALMSDLLTGRKRVTDALPMAAE